MIVESSTEEEGSNPRMRRLVYPISISVTPGGLQSEAAEPPVATTANYYNMWTGSIYMWPDPRAPTTPHAPAPPTHQAYVAGPPAHGLATGASLLSPLSQLHNLLHLLVGISRPLQQALRLCLSLNRHSGTGTSTPVLPATWRPTLVFSLPSPPLPHILPLLLLLVMAIYFPPAPLTFLTILI